ncbi:unnamed protein product [Rotaria sp. Silwood1]|nr:unnamed protein product [Rotaria sp. Silwood1]CAF4921846.1 unnamed protein product [Rotaria sp. Silwood1]
MNSGQRVQSEQRRSRMENINLKSTKHAEYIRKKQEAVENRHRRQYLSQSSYNRSAEESNETSNENTLDEEQTLMTHRDPTSASEFLREIYDKHDKEDLKYGFLENDPEDQDKNHSHAHDRLRVDPNSMNYEEISSPSTGNMGSPYQTTATDDFLEAASAYDEQSSLKSSSVSPNSIVLPPTQDSTSINIETDCMRKGHRVQLGKR